MFKEAWAVDSLSTSWEDMDWYAFPPTPLIANVINKIPSLYSHRIIVPGLAQYVVVFGTSEPVNSDSLVPTLPTQSSGSTIQLEPAWLVPRASTIRVQGFSGQVADQIEALQRRSTIDGYRTAIADKVGNSSVKISKDENLTRLLEIFTGIGRNVAEVSPRGTYI